MNYKKSIIIIVALLIYSIGSFSQKINFAGNWVINKSKTDFGNAPEFVLEKTIKVEQRNDKMDIARIRLDHQLNELPPMIQTLAFDGTSFTGPQPTGPDVTSEMHWQNDQSLIINLKGASTAVETWTLDDGGKTLIINRSVQQSNGMKYSIKAVFDKQ